MYSLNDLKQQNKDIKELSELLLVVLLNANLRGNSHVCDLINQFYDKVWVHLVFEDKVLYTDLLEKVDAEDRQIVIEFHESAKALKKNFGRHIKHWCHLDSDIDVHDDFTEKSSAIINAILGRIKIENEDIFPLVKKYSKDKK